MTYTVGIDVGTTFSAAAIWRDGLASTVTLGDRAATVPSVLFLREDGVMLVGDAAVRRAAVEPARVAREFKRRVGDTIPLVVGDQPFSAAHLTAQVVRWVVGRVAEREGGPAGYAVLTHPASWGPHRLALLAEAAAAAGLPDAGLLPEPVAAGIYYASQQRVPPGSLVAVYDLGGGTFDATLLRKTDDGFEVVGTPRGDDHLGGVDADQMVFDHVVRSLGANWPDVGDDDRVGLAALAQVQAAAVEAKEALSSDTAAVVPVVLPGIATEVRITRVEFERLAMPLVAHTVDLVHQSCVAAGVAASDLDTVLLVGGASRMPLVAQMVTAGLGRPVAVDAHPKYAVCLGAAIAAAARLPGAVSATAGPPSPPAPAVPPPVSTSPPDTTGVPGTTPSAPPGPGGPAAPVTGQDLPAVPTVIGADLDAAAVTAPADRRLPRPRRPPEPPLHLTDRDDRLVVHIGGEVGDRVVERGERRRVLAMALAAAVVVGVALASLVTLGGDGSSGSASSAATSVDAAPGGGTTPPAAAAPGEPHGTATLTAATVSAAGPGSAMLGVATVGDGTLVAVGRSGADTASPAVWRSIDGGRSWSGTATRDGLAVATGALTGVAPVPGGGVVAVGATVASEGEPARPVVWRAPGDGTSGWAPVQAAGLDGAATVHDVVADGTALIAVGRDLTEDPGAGGAPPGGAGDGSGAQGGDGEQGGDAGDGGVWRSSDGVSWQRVATTGLGGPGRQDLLRIVRLPDGRYLAIGRQRQGALLGPALWTSSDLVTWTLATGRPAADDGTPTVPGLAVLPDGAVVAGGARPGLPGAPGGADLALWWAAPTEPERWHVFGTDLATRPTTLSGAGGAGSGGPPGDQRIHALVAPGDGLVAVGADGDRAAAWQVSVDR